MKPNELERLIFSMLTTNTGIHMMDSGGDDNRGWQRNQKKTIADFMKAPSVAFESTNYNYQTKEDERVKSSKEIEYTISLFHYLTNGENFVIDEIARKYNKLKCKDWESDIYGVSERQEKWLQEYDFEIGDSFNSYNGDSNLSQVIQGTYVKLGIDVYVLLQVHNGADVRGGYTDAKMFLLNNDYMPSENVYGTIGEAQIENGYDGYHLADDQGKDVAIPEGAEIQLYI